MSGTRQVIQRPRAIQHLQQRHAGGALLAQLLLLLDLHRLRCLLLETHTPHAKLHSKC